MDPSHDTSFEKNKHLVKAGIPKLSLPDEFILTTTEERTTTTENNDWYRNFVMAQLPEKMREMIESGKMPFYIEEAIFSGKHNRSVVASMIVGNDEVMRGLLPDRVLVMLEVKYLKSALCIIFCDCVFFILTQDIFQRKYLSCSCK